MAIRVSVDGCAESRAGIGKVTRVRLGAKVDAFIFWEFGVGRLDKHLFAVAAPIAALEKLELYSISRLRCFHLARSDQIVPANRPHDE